MAKKAKYTTLIYIAGGLLLAVGGYLGYRKWIASKQAPESQDGSGGGGGGEGTVKSTSKPTTTTTVSPLKVTNRPTTLRPTIAPSVKPASSPVVSPTLKPASNLTTSFAKKANSFTIRNTQTT